MDRISLLYLWKKKGEVQVIRIFDKTDTTFANNGDVVVKPLKAIVHKEDNGSFYLDLSVPLEYADYMEEGRIVVVPTPQGHQGFRIHNPEKTHKRITTRARHIFYDSENYLIEDSYVDNHTCNYALNHLNDATEPTSEFTVISDVSTVNSFRCVRKSLYEAIQTVLERWGGHLVRDNFNIAIRASIGQDNGVTIRYAKNLKEITCQEDWSMVVTQLMPVGYDGILLNSLDESVSPYITSSVQYDMPYTKTVSFTQNIDPDDYESETEYQQALIADLRQQATEYITEHCVPKVNYKLSADVEKISDVGDTIEVIDERLGINIMTNVISYDYDCILGKYTQIEFGNFTQNTMRGFASSIRSTMTDSTNVQIQEASAVMSDELKRATDSIIGMMNDSYVIYDGNQILVVDRLPKESAVNVIRINSGGIGFSNTGINGTFNSAWLINGTLDMQAINVINLAVSMISGIINNGQGWELDFDNGTFTIGNISADNINTGTLSVNRIAGNSIAIGKLDSTTQDKIASGVTAYNRKSAMWGTSSASATATNKTVVNSGFTSSDLVAGAVITVKFTNGNIATSALTLNVNSTGAKTIYVGGYTTSVNNQLLWASEAVLTFVYDGTYWIYADSPSVYKCNESTTSASTASKTATVSGAKPVICAGTIVTIPMTYENTSTSATLSINFTGAKNLYYGTSTTRPTTSNGHGWIAGMTVAFQFDGQYWRVEEAGTIIDGDHILTGTIDASKVNVTNLSASSITTGTLSANLITSGTMSADRISGGTMSLTGGYLRMNNASNNMVYNFATAAVYGASIFDGNGHECINMSPIYGLSITDSNSATSTGSARNYAKCRIETSGAVTCVSLTQTSDINAKTDISDISQTEAERFILALQPKQFKFKDIDGIHHGFIAQDVEKVVNDWNVVTESDNGFKSLAYNEIIADLVATVQAQQKRIERLEEIVYGENSNNNGNINYQ